jgi:hypothetical protein
MMHRCYDCYMYDKMPPEFCMHPNPMPKSTASPVKAPTKSPVKGAKMMTSTGFSVRSSGGKKKSIRSSLRVVASYPTDIKSSVSTVSTLQNQNKQQDSPVPNSADCISASNLFNIDGRGYPDLAFLGTDYAYIFQERPQTISSSQSTAVITALLATINAARVAQNYPQLGWVNPALYYYADHYIYDITEGQNNYPSDGTTDCRETQFAFESWDAVTGLGSLNAQVFSVLFQNVTTPLYTTSPPTHGPTKSPKPNLGTILPAALVPGVAFMVLLLGGLYMWMQSRRAMYDINNNRGTGFTEGEVEMETNRV